MAKLNRELEELCINTIRILSADAVQNANAGHPGMPMGAAAMAYTLWTQCRGLELVKLVKLASRVQKVAALRGIGT